MKILNTLPTQATVPTNFKPLHQLNSLRFGTDTASLKQKHNKHLLQLLEKGKAKEAATYWKTTVMGISANKPLKGSLRLNVLDNATNSRETMIQECPSAFGMEKPTVAPEKDKEWVRRVDLVIALYKPLLALELDKPLPIKLAEIARQQVEKSLIGLIPDEWKVIAGPKK